MRKCVCLLALLAGSLSVFAGPPSVSVPLSSPVYPLIDQLVVTSGVSLPNLYSRPFTRKQVAGYLFDIRSEAGAGRLMLSRVENEAVEYWWREFSLDGRHFEKALANQEKHIYVFDNPEKGELLTVDLGLKDSSAWSFNGGHGFMAGTIYGGVRGLIREQVAFRSDVTVSSEISTDSVYRQSDYDPTKGYPYNTPGDSGFCRKKAWDTFESGIFFENRICNIELGVDRLRFGPAEINPVTLSGAAPPVGVLKLETDFWRVHYIQTVDVIKGKKYRDKYMYAHRLEVDLPQNFRVGVNEVLVYGDSAVDSTQNNGRIAPETRYFDPIYSIPFVPYYFAQHYGGDRDNMSLSFDVTCHRVPRTKIYAELFLDDLVSPLDLFDDYWQNKWAFSGGAHYYLPVKWPDMSALIEYSRVEPWTYTHFFGESHTYRHYGQSLGAQIGPNADQVCFNFNLKTSRKLSFDLFARNLRQDRGLRGDSISHIFNAMTDNTGKHFLEGSVDTRRLIGLAVTAEPTRLIRLKFQYDQSLLDAGDIGLRTVVDLNW